MKIARISYKEKEYYGIINDNSFFQISEFSRNDLGIENYFFINLDQIEKKERLCEINDKELIWLTPVARPGKIICIGRNYMKHSLEQGKEVETKPLLFSKYSSSMVPHLSHVNYPSHTSNLDYEVELAVVIGKNATKITDNENPLEYVFGYTVANDLTARDVQKSEKQWTRGKAFDQSLVIGPHILTSDEIDDPQKLEIWLNVNGENRQLSDTSKMIFTVSFLIKYISQQITLEPGDIILTGTPSGVGYYMEPRAVLQKGDHISCGVTGVGELRFSIKE